MALSIRYASGIIVSPRSVVNYVFFLVGVVRGIDSSVRCGQLPAGGDGIVLFMEMGLSWKRMRKAGGGGIWVRFTVTDFAVP